MFVPAFRVLLGTATAVDGPPRPNGYPGGGQWPPGRLRRRSTALPARRRSGERPGRTGPANAPRIAGADNVDEARQGSGGGGDRRHRRKPRRARQRAARALARPGPVPRRLRPRRRLESPAGPAGRRGHPVHPGTRHRAAVLAVARITVHRPLSAEQRTGRTGPPRLGISPRRPHAAADSLRIWLVFSSFRDAARDVPSRAAGFRRVRRIELLLRVCRRTGSAVAARP